MKTEYGEMCTAVRHRPAATLPVAGLTSALHGQVTGMAMEPRMLRKKRSTTLLSDSEAAKEFVLLGNQRKFAVNVPYKLPAAKSKCASASKAAKKAEAPVEPARLLPVAPETRFDTGRPSPKKKAKKCSKISSPKKSGKPGKPAKPRSKHSKAAEEKLLDEAIEAIDNNNNNNNADVARSNSVGDNKANDVVKDAQDTESVDKGLDYVMRYRAGLNPKRNAGSLKRSEYQKMFKWKQCERPTPVLAANQVVYNSNSHMQPSSVTAAVSSATEYRSQFKPWSSPSNADSSNANNNNNNNAKESESNDGNSRHHPQPTKTSKDSTKYKVPIPSAHASPAVTQPRPLNDNNEMPAAGLPSKTVHEPIRTQTLKTSQEPIRKQIAESPNSPVKSSPSQYCNWSSEYGANYQPFTHFSYDQGMWRGATSPHKKTNVTGTDKPPCDVTQSAADATATNWFAEVRELREKAEEYRRRARGMHFSREHVGQLLASQAKLWDGSTIASNVSELSLGKEPVDSDESTPMSSASQQAPLSSAVRQAGTHRLAWSHDGSRSTSESDTVRSIRSGHTAEIVQEVSNSNEVKADRSQSYVPATEPARPAAVSGRCDCVSEDPPMMDVDVSKSAPGYSESPLAAPTSPVAGRPTQDTHDLVDDSADNDEVLQTRYLGSPARRKDKAEAGMKTLMEGAAETYNIPIKDITSPDKQEIADNEDGEPSQRSLMSSSMLSVASSTSSLASELLDRAEKRRAEFWATRTKPSRR